MYPFNKPCEGCSTPDACSTAKTCSIARGKPNQDLSLIAPGIRRVMVESLIENKSWIKCEADALLEMQNMSVHELLDLWLNWQGIIGFTESIVLALDGIRKAKGTNE